MGLRLQLPQQVHDNGAISLKNWDAALSRFLLFYVGIKLFTIFIYACIENVVDIGSV